MHQRYYIMFHPAAFNLMDLTEKGVASPWELVAFLTGRDVGDLTPDNFLNYLHFDEKKIRGEILEYFGMENYASYYIANQLAKADIHAKIILADNRRRPMNEIIQNAQNKPRAVFISTISSNFPTAVAAALPLNVARIPVVFGGIHVSTSSRDLDTYLRRHVPFPELIACVKGAGDAATITRITTDLRNGTLQPEYSGTRTMENTVWGDPNVTELPAMPLSFFRKIPVIGAYLGKGLRIHVTTPYLGCPYSCRFCSISSLPHSRRALSTRHPDDFLDELTYIQKKKPAFLNRFFFFLPDNLLLAKNHLETILDGIIERNLNLNYAAQVSINVAEDETLMKKLRLSGASHFFIGFESLDIRNLEYIGKNAIKAIRRSGLSVAEYYSACIRKITRHGISVHGAFIAGLPYDYFHSMDNHTGRDIAAFCVQNKIGLQPASLTALPGSITFREQLEQGSLLYPPQDSMNYLLSLCLADLSEMNFAVPVSLKKSRLVVAYMVFDAVRRVGAARTAFRNAAHMGLKAWQYPTQSGRFNLKERLGGVLAAMFFQLGASAYKELGESLAFSTADIRGTFERLFDQEKDPGVKQMFEKFVAQFKYGRN